MKALIKKVKLDIKNRKKGNIFELPLNKDYAKEFNLTERQVKTVLGKCLTKEEKDYRVSEIRSQTGKKSKGNPKFGLSKLTPEERRSNNLRSEQSEKIAKEIKEKEGFKVIKIASADDGPGTYTLHEEEIIKLKNGKNILKVFDKLRISISNFKYPDFVCEKGDKVIFIEVKCGELNHNYFKQKRSLQALQKEGYDFEIFCDFQDNKFKKIHRGVMPQNSEDKDAKDKLDNFIISPS